MKKGPGLLRDQLPKAQDGTATSIPQSAGGGPGPGRMLPRSWPGRESLATTQEWLAETWNGQLGTKNTPLKRTEP